MKNNKFQITMPELQKIIKEEYATMASKAEKAEKIKARIKAINEELSSMPKKLDEVEASGTKQVKSTGWTGAGKHDTKYGEKFEKIGSHLKEDEEIDGEIELGGEEMEAEEMGYFEMKFAELGKELDAKVGGGIDMDSDEIEIGAEDMDSDDIDADDMGSEEMGLEMGSEDEEVEEEEIEEYAEIQPDGEDGHVQKVNEDLEEPIEGDTPAQDSDARFNDYMDKDKHVHEGKSSKGTTLLSEGFTSAKKSALDNELERMKKLAKINK